MMEQTPLAPIFWSKVLGKGSTPTPSGTISITENGTYDVAGFAEAEVNVAGGGGAQLIASGTWTGAGVPNAEFFVGKKMPKQDFVFLVFAPDGEEFPMNTDYKFSVFYADSAFAVYDLSADSNNCPVTSRLNYVVDDNGTLKTLQQRGNWWAGVVRNAAPLYTIQGNAGYNRIKRTSSGFSVLFLNYSQAYYWVSGKTYNWELLYFGSDPNNDIVEVP